MRIFRKKDWNHRLELIINWDRGGEMDINYCHNSQSPCFNWGRVSSWILSRERVHKRSFLRLKKALQPLVERVLDGYDVVWNGRDHVAEFDEDAEEALQEICDYIQDWDIDE